MPEIRYVRIDDLETHPEKRVSVPDLADHWGVHKATVYRLTENGALPALRIGRRVVVSREDALRFERECGRPEDERPDGQGRR